jgi:hypothetical protein
LSLSESEKLQRISVFKAQIQRLLSSAIDDASLLAQLNGFGRASMLPGFVWLWGPQVYARNAAMFRPFILANFSQSIQVDAATWTYQAVEWKGESGKALEDWLLVVDKADDVLLFKQLYRWKLQDQNEWKARESRFDYDLKTRWKTVKTPAERVVALRKMDVGFAISEDTAITLFGDDPQASKDFILRRTPGGWGESRKLWQRLFDIASNEPEFRWALYRKQVPQQRWADDVRVLAASDLTGEVLTEELNRRHAEGWDLKRAEVFLGLLQVRGHEALPYLRKHLRSISSYSEQDALAKLIALAAAKQFWELWAALLLVCARGKDYDKALAKLLVDPALDEATRLSRLSMLSGVSREWNGAGFGLAQIQTLEDDTALSLYEHYPDLVRGPFRAHVAPGWGQGRGGLLYAAIQAGDEILIDFLTARLITRTHMSDSIAKAVNQAAKYFEELRLQDTAFAARAARVLTQVPAYTIYDYNKLIADNPLARLLFARSTSFYLSSDVAVSDLVEASEVHVMQLAYRALGLDDDRARQLAPRHRMLLMGTLLRPMQRRTRLLAFKALANATQAQDDAQAVLARAREALTLIDTKYPKDGLMLLIGLLLARHPGLAQAQEAPLVYRRASPALAGAA